MHCLFAILGLLAAYTSTPVLFDDAEPGDVLQGMLGDQMKPLKTFYFVAVVRELFCGFKLHVVCTCHHVQSLLWMVLKKRFQVIAGCSLPLLQWRSSPISSKTISS